MRLLKKLGRESLKNRFISIGLFLCSYCRKEVKKELSNGNRAKSCGCERIKLIVKSCIIHGDSKKNSKYYRLYIIWINMRLRCKNINDKDYKNYGGRNIKVCEEWKNSYISFKKWALNNGYKDNLTIDRKDNNKNYEPNNCRFILRAENNRNRRCNKLTLEKANKIRNKYKKQNITQKELGKLYGVCQNTIKEIIHNKIWKE